MIQKAIIFDLDNTIYPVSSISDRLFAPLFHLLVNSGELNHNIEQVKEELMRKPFQVVADGFGFSKELRAKGINLLKNLSYEGPIKPFPDYNEIKTLPVSKYLVTSGFDKLQQNKIKGMGIESDFREIHIVDVETSSKKEVFADLMKRNNYQPEELLVVGDDLHSEIKAALELGIAAILYDKNNSCSQDIPVPKISDFKQLQNYL